MNKKVKTPSASPRVRAGTSAKTLRTPTKSASSTKKTSARTSVAPRARSVARTTTPARTSANARAGVTSTKTTSRTGAKSSARISSKPSRANTKNVVKNTTPKSKISKSTKTPTKSSKKSKNLQKILYYHRISIIARAICVIAFASLIFVGVSQMVRAFSLEQVDNQNGIPMSWGLTSAANPDTIEVPITYWDQHRDCKMFEFSYCNISNAKKQGGLEQGIVKDYLGSDGLPIPTQETANPNFYPTDQSVTGHDPVQTSDNFYRWFHAVDGKSFKYDRTLTFTRVGDTNEYTYGGRQIFPLDDVASATQKLLGHNFHFTAHMSVPIKVTLSGNEVFDFSGDDDVWVFLNNRLVLDIGGVHTAVDGHFTVNADGSVTSSVDGKTPVNIDLGLEKGQVINLDFFYAERNTSEANTRITISDMQWPISADAKLSSQVIDNKIIEYTASVTNRDPQNEVTVNRVAAYLSDQLDDPGFIPLTAQTLSYSMNNSVDPSEWHQLEVAAPANSDDGFALTTPVKLAKFGSTGDTLYLRYYVAPEQPDIDYISTISFYTEDMATNSGISFDTVTNSIQNLEVIVPGGDENNDDPADEPGDNPGGDPDPTDPTDNSGSDPADDPADNPGNTDPIDDNTNPDPDPTPTPDPDPEPEPDPTPTLDPEPEPTPDPEPSKPNVPGGTIIIPNNTTKKPNNNTSADETKGTGGNTSPTTPSNDSADPVTPDPVETPTDTPTEDTPSPADPEPTSDDVIYEAPKTAPAYADATDDEDPFSTYLPVLGTVHYTPNTGVVTQLLSTPFNNQAFSSVVLSQPYLLANLAVFAVSFAIFFPLRRY